MWLEYMKDQMHKIIYFLGKFTIELDKKQKEKKITILMELVHNWIL